MRSDERTLGRLGWLAVGAGIAFVATVPRGAARSAASLDGQPALPHPPRTEVLATSAAPPSPAAPQTSRLRGGRRWLAAMGLVALAVVLPAVPSASTLAGDAPPLAPSSAIAIAAPRMLAVDPDREALGAERPLGLAAILAPAFEGAQVVSFYGYPGQPVMGILGAYEPEDAAKAVVEFTQAQAVPGRPRGVPALHLIVGVAQPTPQADGSYLARMEPALIERYVTATREQGVLLFLDVQVGWSDALIEVQQLERFLREPHVQLALDPEFATRAEGRAPGQVIGTLTAEDVNRVQHYVAEFVQRERLPRKLLVLHQFMDHMLPAPELYEAHPEVEISIDMDGFGSPAAKLSKYDLYSLGAYSERPAIKLFFNWDAPVLTPDDLARLPLAPGLVIYQ